MARPVGKVVGEGLLSTEEVGTAHREGTILDLVVHGEDGRVVVVDSGRTWVAGTEEAPEAFNVGEVREPMLVEVIIVVLEPSTYKLAHRHLSLLE